MVSVCNSHKVLLCWLDTHLLQCIKNGSSLNHKGGMLSLQRVIKAQVWCQTVCWSACLWKEDAAVVSGCLEEWQLVASMNLRFKGRFRSEFVCVSKAVQILLKLSRFKFEVKLQKRMVSTGFGTRHIWYFEELVQISESLSCRFSHRD